MSAALKLLAVAAAGAGALLFTRRASAAPAAAGDAGSSSSWNPALSELPGVDWNPFDFTGQTMPESTQGWLPEDAAGRARAEPYINDLHAAEDRHGIPRGLMVRLAWQESRYRPEIIDGSRASSAGALGIVQIVPRWHPDADPLNPPAAIDYGAQYLRSLFDRFGTWQLALIGYNWGPTALSKHLRGDDRYRTIPGESQAYHAEILHDVNRFSGTLIA